jgi:Ca2+-dependent lipid-binding protein
MVGSVLTVNVVEARDLKSTRLVGSCNPYVALTIGDEQRQLTDTVYGQVNPVWNEVMSFDIKTGNETLIARVFDKADRVGNDTLLGYCKINIDTLHD